MKFIGLHLCSREMRVEDCVRNCENYSHIRTKLPFSSGNVLAAYSALRTGVLKTDVNRLWLSWTLSDTSDIPLHITGRNELFAPLFLILGFMALYKSAVNFLLFLTFTHRRQLKDPARGVDPYGTGGTRPPQYLDRGGDMITNVPPPNISREISATFYPCNIILISWKSF